MTTSRNSPKNKDGSSSPEDIILTKKQSIKFGLIPVKKRMDKKLVALRLLIVAITINWVTLAILGLSSLLAISTLLIIYALVLIVADAER